MLRYLAERGISPGDRFEVIDRQPFDGPVFVRFGEDVHVLGDQRTDHRVCSARIALPRIPPPMP
jgi:Fe2+ transport system protein FeoA